MHRFLQENRLFLGLSLLLILVLACLIGNIPKAELHLLLCDRHLVCRDIFYTYYTQVGEWVPYVVCVALLFYKAGWSAFTAAGTLLSGLMTQIVKRIVNAPRPVTYFADNYPDITLPLVNGVHISHHYSFPSGHTTTFFALFFALCIIGTQYIYSRPDKKKTLFAALWQIFCFLFAALGAYSRIYLSQHFATDILGGMCVGLLITTLLYSLFFRFQDAKWWNWRIPTEKMHFSAKKVS